MSVASVVTGITSVGLGIASELVSDSKTAFGLGMAGLVMGLFSGAGAIAAGRLIPQAGSLAGKFAGFVRSLVYTSSEFLPEIELSPMAVAHPPAIKLDQLLDVSYPAEQRILNYLDTASVHNLRQTSKAFGPVADRAMAVRMKTTETGIPNATVRFEDFARRWSRLPKTILEGQLTASTNRDLEITNPEFITWAKKNMLGLGRSRPVGLNDGPVPEFLQYFEPNETMLTPGVIQQYDFAAEAFHSEHRDAFIDLLAENNWDNLISWEQLNNGFWLGI